VKKARPRPGFFLVNPKVDPPRKKSAISFQRENFLYFSRCGMTLSVPSRRIFSAS
jgi:hypothetical protein